VNSGNRSRVNSGNRSRVNRRNRPRVNSGNRSRVNSGNRSRVNSGNRSRVNSGNRSRQNSGNRSRVNSGNRSRQNSGNRSRIDHWEPIYTRTVGTDLAGSESRPPMLNKENYMPWSSRLLCYAKSRPNGKLIHNSIINGPFSHVVRRSNQQFSSRPYVRRMTPEPGDTNREDPVTETFHVQTDDELIGMELKQIEADDQAIQTILLGLPEDIYAAVDSCETAQEIWLRVQQMMKGSDIGI
nr:integrase, catalytic region, zinc finger, CCHC-type, peptidase aspartic, catalytic [Tanacetum cinerariifolium]